MLQMFKRNRQRKLRRKAVYCAFKKVLEAEVVQFPWRRQKPRALNYPLRPEQLPDYETVARWLRLADELLGPGKADSDDCRSSDDRKRA